MPVNHLARLPAELVQEICDLVQSSDQPVSLVVSKSLFPFLHRARYRYLRVVGSTANRLDHLASYAYAHPADLASTVSFFCGKGQPTSPDDVETLRMILVRMPNVRSLTLTLHEPVSPPELLYHLPHPEKLTDLGWILHSYRRVISPTVPSTLQNLESVRFGGTGFALTDGLLDSLLKLPLRTLSFEKGLEFDPRLIERFVAGRMKHSTLRQIVFNHVAAKAGTPARDVRLTPRSYELSARQVLSDWEIPDWQGRYSSDSSRWKLTLLLDGARREGLDVLGTAVEALAITDAFERDVAMLDAKLESVGWR
ncbi:hypothetical protein JCM10212_000706 [Sporobolomyces blumeae]